MLSKKDAIGGTKGGKTIYAKTYTSIFAVLVAIVIFLQPSSVQAVQNCTIGTAVASITLDMNYITTNNCNAITIANTGNNGKITLNLSENLDLLESGVITIQAGVIATFNGPLTLGNNDTLILDGVSPLVNPKDAYRAAVQLKNFRRKEKSS